MGGIYNSTNLRCQGGWHIAKRDRRVVSQIECSANVVMPGTGALLKTLLK